NRLAQPGAEIPAQPVSIEGDPVMKDVRFYLEFPTKGTKKRSGKANTGHSGSVTAVLVGTQQITGSCGRWTATVEAISGLFEGMADSPVCGTAVAVDW